MEAAGNPPLQKPPGLRDQKTQTVMPVTRPKPPPSGRKWANPPSSFHPKKRSRSCCPICCCLFCCFISIFIIFLLLVGGIFYLLYEPKLPIFRLNSFKLTQFNVTAKPDGTYLDVQTTSRIEIKNPNSKIQIAYGKTSVAISVTTNGGDEMELGTTEIDKFTQGKKNTTNLKVNLGLKNREVNAGFANKLKKGYENGDLKVGVEVKTGLGFFVEGFKIGPLGVDINCGGVTLKKLENGDMPKCSIQTLKW